MAFDKNLMLSSQICLCKVIIIFFCFITKYIETERLKYLGQNHKLPGVKLRCKRTSSVCPYGTLLQYDTNQTFPASVHETTK